MISPTTRRRVALAGAVLLLAALALRVGTRSREAAPPSPVPAIDNPGPQGLEAAYRYLLRTAHARVLDGPFDALDASTQVLITALPHARPVEPDEQRAVLAWVEGGGTLVVLGEHQRGLGGALAGVLDPPSAALHLEAGDLGLADVGRGVKALLDAAARPEPVEVVRGLPLVPDPLLAGVDALAVSAGRGFEIAPSPAVPVVAAHDTALVLSLARGKGRILAFAGPDAFTNARIDRGSNLQLLANLAALGQVTFDEHHHQPAPAAGLRELGRAFGPALLGLLLSALALVASGSRRLGPPQPLPPPAGPSLRTAATQLGRLYRRAGASPHLAAALHRELREQLARELRLPVATGDAALLRALQLARPDLHPQASALLGRFTRAERIDPAAYLDLSRGAEQLRRALARSLLTAPAAAPMFEGPPAARAHPDPHG